MSHNITTDKGQPPHRRPSWTPSLPNDNAGPSTSSAPTNTSPTTLSKRRSIHGTTSSSISTSRHVHRDEDVSVLPNLGPGSNFVLSPMEWSGISGVHNVMKTRRSSFAPSSGEKSFRSRRSRVTDHRGQEGSHHPSQSPEIAVPGSSSMLVTSPEGSGLPESPEDAKTFSSCLEINVKDLVGDAVGNMSISPASRDIVLAARRGLFIIDLESPLRTPRFLPQGGTWDVADVQWNPHPSHAQYIVSTSSEKLLIWNLRLAGKTSIEHILRSHYRAITDINWHTTECDVVVSVGIDSWLWAWDIREPRKPIFGLSAFNAGGTQVKWNRQDGNLLASSHAKEVLIWDRRKGSLPISRIQAHSSKIYGIDWSQSSRNMIVTCSLDKTIKTWDINETGPNPVSSIVTTYPVWRARNLPFGEGVLSLPQRGETTLEMYARTPAGSVNEAGGSGMKLVETFEGHSDVVKEFVWRKGGNGDFQLITWSKDRTLRLWPIDSELMQKVGHTPEVVRGRSKLTRMELENLDSFVNPPEVETQLQPTISAPIGNRSILAEVRAPLPPHVAISHPHINTPDRVPSPPSKSSLVQDTDSTIAATTNEAEATPTLTSTKSVAISMANVSRSTGGTMSKGGQGPKSVVQVDPLAWLASVRVGSKRGSSSGNGDSGSRTGSGAPSRLGSISRGGSQSRLDMSVGPDGSATRTRSGSVSRSGVGEGSERASGETSAGQSLQDEITSVLTKLSGSKIKLEKHDLTKKRTCTLGLHGPWGETSSVFLRVTFHFPRDYPLATHPHGTPTVEVERNPLISAPDRTFILKKLRRIRERRRPCLEACLRFLLFANEGSADQDSDSDSDSDDEPASKKARDITVSLLRNHKNLAEPRTSQGSFGPNGELVLFFRAPPRLVRGVSRGQPSATRTADETGTDQPQSQPVPKSSYFQSPALVSDAVRRLGLAAMDRVVRPIDPKQPEMGISIARAMTNLLTIQHPRELRRDSDARPMDDASSINNGSNRFSLIPTRRSTVHLTSTMGITGSEKKMGEGYVFSGATLRDVCEKNAEFAREMNRFEHERVFRTLKSLFREPEETENVPKADTYQGTRFASDALAVKMIHRLYNESAKEKDLQMLAMLAMIVLQTEHGKVVMPALARKKEASTPLSALPFRLGGGLDYFSMSKSIPSPTHAPSWPRNPSPILPSAPSLSTSNSSRGSWSSLFNPGSMRQFMITGMQDALRDGLTTPTEIPNPNSAPDLHAPHSRSSDKSIRALDSPGLEPRKRRTRKDSSAHSPSIASKSWNENTGVLKGPMVSAAPLGNKRLSLRFMDPNMTISEKRAIVFKPPPEEDNAEPLFNRKFLKQLRMNVYMYAELLFRWQLFDKRLELLKAVEPEKTLKMPAKFKVEPHKIGEDIRFIYFRTVLDANNVVIL
ncbi:hypothetical protein CVT24_011818 [Panaeolus cyanescens]|uniref:RWD domain-containing protein n=1 Tax=Panaeolus cyanescens TaxID=181874 RepID=A0A409VH75_9AGAR|nr:hypothetical protein CVT24_011818 [Panaeolus cyanescens]